MRLFNLVLYMLSCFTGFYTQAPTVFISKTTMFLPFDFTWDDDFTGEKHSYVSPPASST